MRRVADILAEELARQGLRQVFMLTGGGAMHLNDAFGRCKDLQIFFNHHEQAGAMAAESYCRLSGVPAILNVTTGPGGINALNGVYGAYVDSIAMIVISGQIKRDTMIGNYPLPLRQLGDQEVDIIAMASPVTKYAVELQDPYKVKEVAAKAVYLATHGRPGPVWIDIPMDIQGYLVEETKLSEWNADVPGAMESLRGDPALNPTAQGDFCRDTPLRLKSAAKEIVRRLKMAKRPVLLGGTGVHIAGEMERFRNIAALLGIPAVGGWNAYDLIPNEHPCYSGRPGTLGDRPGNFVVQNADFLLILGCRLNIRQISYNWENFAPKAWKAQVDIDPSELRKPTLNNDLLITADLREFLPVLEETLGGWTQKPEHVSFLAWSKGKVATYPVLQKRQTLPGAINPYYFMERLFEYLNPDDIVVAGNGSACVTSFQAGKIKKFTRLYTNSGDASMGYDLPAAIGAALAAGGKRIICLAGDGSIMMNLQELATIAGEKLPVYIYLLNNKGYHSIRQTQQAYFPDNILGIDEHTGVHFPSFMKLGECFGLPGLFADKNEDIDSFIQNSLAVPAPCLHEVALDPAQNFEPKTASRKLPDGTMFTPSMDDMAPFLSPEELKQNRLD